MKHGASILWIVAFCAASAALPAFSQDASSLLGQAEKLPANLAPDGDILYPPVSYDGRYIAFHSSATNLITDDSNGVGDVFVVDREARLIQRVSTGGKELQGNGNSTYPTIAGYGQFVAFTSDATNLVPNDSNQASDVFVVDTKSGKLELVSRTPQGEPASGPSYSYFPSISADGQVVVFNSNAPDLVDGDTNGTWDVLALDRRNGIIKLVSLSNSGERANGPSMHGVVSGNGRYVAFHSQASNLISDDNNGVSDVFLHDLETGQTTLISRATDGRPGNGRSERASISDSGSRVSFSSDATNLVGGDTNNVEDVFVFDQDTRKIIRASVKTGGEQFMQLAGPAKLDRKSVISPDGTAVAFRSGGDTLVAAAGNPNVDVYLHTIAKNTTELASAWPDGLPIDGDTEHHALSYDASVVAFSVVVPQAATISSLNRLGKTDLLSVFSNDGAETSHSLGMLWDRKHNKRGFILEDAAAQ